MGNVCASKDSLPIVSAEAVKQVSLKGQTTPPARFSSDSEEDGLVSGSTESEVDPSSTSQHSTTNQLFNSKTDEVNTSAINALDTNPNLKEGKIREDLTALALETKQDDNKVEIPASVQEADDDVEDEDEDDDTPFKPYTLQDIRNKIDDLSKQVPKASKAANIDYTCPTQVREWGESIERLTDQYYLLIYCVSSATYKWNGKRSGAEDQNLGYLNQGIDTANNMIIHAVEKDMTTDTMAPRKWKTLSKTVESEDKKTGGAETKYIYEDNKEESHVRQQYVAKKLSRNATLQRHILLTAFDLSCRCIDDYLEASQQDEQVETSQYDYMY